MTVAANVVDGAAVLTPDGSLDSSTYRPLRDTVIQAALEEPRAVIVDVTHLEVPAETAWSVFSSARFHVVTWPNTPIMIVCEQAERRAAISRVGVSRRVPVFQTIAAALATLRPLAANRHTARAALPARLSSLSWSRELVEQWLRTWGRSDLICVTQVIITALIENVLKHTDSRPDVRLETDGATVTVAVEDSSQAQACIPEASSGNPPSGLRIVNALCRRWGNAPMLSGKTVWAVIGPENRL